MKKSLLFANLALAGLALSAMNCNNTESKEEPAKNLGTALKGQTCVEHDCSGKGCCAGQGTDGKNKCAGLGSCAVTKADLEARGCEKVLPAGTACPVM